MYNVYKVDGYWDYRDLDEWKFSEIWGWKRDI